MRDFNKVVQIERFNLGVVKSEDLGKKIYEQGMGALKGVMYTGDGASKIKVLDLHCSQSYVRDFIDDKFDYAGLDPKLNFERDGQKIVPDIQSDINNIPLKEKTVDFIFAVGQRLAYGENHASVFEIERVIKPQGYLVVALTRYWWQKGFNQLLFCYRGWHYVKAIEINYKIADGEGARETSKYFAVYQYQKG